MDASTVLIGDYFRLYGLEPSFDISLDGLLTRYRDLQREFHPDRFASSSAQERRLSVQISARINEAYHVLSDPLLRAKYLLELLGHPPQANPARLDMEFLQNQIELREEWEDIREQGEVQRARMFLEDLETKANHEAKSFSEQIGAVARQADRLDEVLQTFYHMQFYHRQLADCRSYVSEKTT